MVMARRGELVSPHRLCPAACPASGWLPDAVLDDEEGASFRQYSDEKLFGIKDLSATDRQNLAEGTESVTSRPGLDPVGDTLSISER